MRKRYEFMVDNLKELTKLYQTHDALLNFHPTTKAKSFLKRYQSISRPIAQRMCLNPLRPLVIVEISHFSFPNGCREWDHFDHLAVECEQGLVFDAELKLAMGGRLPSIKEIYQEAKSIRESPDWRGASGNNTEDGFFGVDGPGIREFGGNLC